MPVAKGTRPWNAGTSKGWIDKRGYRWIYVLENGRRRAKREHRHIMECHLGRRLSPEEVVHHINGDTSDNRVENLEVKQFGVHTTDHHRGTKKSEQARITQSVLAEYREETRRLKLINSDLLAALKGMLDHFGILEDNPFLNKKAVAASKAARAAIAKAEGRS